MAINTTTLEANLTTKINATSGTTDGKEFLLLGKAVESLTIPASVSAMTAAGTTQVGLVNSEGTTQVAAVQAAGSNYATLTGATFTGDVNFGTNKITYSNVYSALSDLPSAASFHGMFAHVHATGKGYYAHGGNWIELVSLDTSGNLTVGGNLTVSGTTTTVNSTTMDVTDKNITVAKGAANSAAADGGGLTIEGAGVTFNYVDANKHMALNTGLKVEEIKEAVTADTTTTGTINVDGLAGAIRNFTVNQTANRTINFRGDGSTALNAAMAIGESMTFAIIMAQGSTAYYLNAYQIDGSAVTPKWQGGSAPTGGNASSVDSYSFTIIKTAASTYTVLASLAAFA